MSATITPLTPAVGAEVGNVDLAALSPETFKQIEAAWYRYSVLLIRDQKLTDDDLTTINGKREQLVGKLQQRYGMEKDRAEEQVDDFIRKLSDSDVRSESHKTHGASS